MCNVFLFLFYTHWFCFLISVVTGGFTDRLERYSIDSTTLGMWSSIKSKCFVKFLCESNDTRVVIDYISEMLGEDPKWIRIEGEAVVTPF